MSASETAALTVESHPASGFPPTIYHYCRTETLVEILQTKAVWLSDARHMNDYKEGLWAYELVDRFIKERTEKAAAAGAMAMVLGMFEVFSLNRLQLPKTTPSAVENAFNETLYGNATSAFVGCFAEVGDLLSQWRAYADDGRGVAIGFDPHAFGLALRPAYVSRDAASAIGLVPVVYDREVQRRMVGERLERYLREPTADPAKAKDSAARCAADLGAMSMMFKNPAFSEEHEWRIVHTPMRLGKGEMDFQGAVADVRYRVSAGTLVPYFPFSFAASPLPAVTEVVLGPRNASLWTTVKGLLASAGYPDAKVRKSAASYR